MKRRTSKPRGWYGAARRSAVLALLFALALHAPELFAQSWITHPSAVAADAAHKPIALQFRREFFLVSTPRKFVVHASADNRFILFVNGRRAGSGPARGDLAHWRYERLDIAPYLHRGRNVIAAEVWNDADFAPRAQITARTAWMLQAEDEAGRWLDSGPEWQVRADDSRTVANGMVQINRIFGQMLYVGGAPETHDGSRHDWGWAARSSTAGDWTPAVDAVGAAKTPPWTLMVDPLPPMAYGHATGGTLVRRAGVAATRFPEGPLIVPAHAQATLLLDSGKVEAAYPVLTTSGGKGAFVQITYSEALYGPNLQRLTDRNQVAGGQALGLSDSFLPDGGQHRDFETLWWRVWRYAEIKVKTDAEPLRLDAFQRRRTGYPFHTDAHFASSDPDLDQIWRIGWDTIRLDAHETYMDTAYWEQLQYVGDTRLSALVTYAAARDSRLPVEAIEAIEQSNPGGLPRSRGPSRVAQSIPPYALLWIGMLYDNWMYRSDTVALRGSLATMRRTLDWYADHIDPQRLIAPTNGWDFIDWRTGLGNYPGLGKHPDNRCVISLMYVGALRQSAALERALGDPALGQADQARAEQVAGAVRGNCWSAERGLFANDPDRQAFSQQANALAVLYDVAPVDQHAAIIDRVTVRGHGIDAAAGVTGTTYYFSFYLVRALEHAGLADRYFEILTTWRDLLAKHFTTWPETPDPSRSDSHAWSAHPTFDLLSLVAGVEPASPGFATVRIRPHLGSLTFVDATTAHPRGQIETRYRRAGDKLRAEISLPQGIFGTFEWNGRSHPLHPGRNALTVPSERITGAGSGQ